MHVRMGERERERVLWYCIFLKCSIYPLRARARVCQVDLQYLVLWYLCGSQCGESGTSFANLLVEQYQGVSKERGGGALLTNNTEMPQFPLDYIWEEDN